MIEGKFQWKAKARMAHLREEMKRAILIERIRTYADKIDWSELSCNQALTPDLVLAFKDKPWDWEILAARISVDSIFEHSELPWHNYGFFMSMNPTLQWHHIVEHPEIQYQWMYVSLNKNMRLEHVLQHPDHPWNWYSLSQNSGIVQSIDTVLQHPELPWCWRMISVNDHISLKDVLEHPECPWDWHYLTRNASIRWPDDICAHPSKSWDWTYISRYFDVNIKQVIDHPDIPWDWEYLTMNLNISIEDMDAFPQLPWDPMRLKMRREGHPYPMHRLVDKPYYSHNMPFLGDWMKNALNFVLMTFDARTTWEFITERGVDAYPWDWAAISRKPDFLELTFLDKRRIIAALQIRRILVACMTNPYHAICRRRLQHDYAQQLCATKIN